MSKLISPLSSPVPYTSLLNHYAKSDRRQDALKVFDEMPHRDAVAWNSLISCWQRNDCIDDALLTFRSMVEGGVRFTNSTLCSILKACSKSQGVRLGKQIHAWACVSGCARGSVVMATCLVDYYSRCGRMEDAVCVFNEVRCEKDVAIYNALLSGFVVNKQFEDAFMMLRGMETNAVALSSVLNACSELSSLAYGKQIHCLMLRRGFECDTILWNALLVMYGECGEIKAVKLVFDQIHEKSVVSWTSIIDAYGSHGFGTGALNLFERMEKESDLLPNSVTFLSVLSACNHSGLVEEGRKCLLAMRDKYGLEPSPEHYACYLDLLGRAGKIEEAWGIFCSLDRVTHGVCTVMLNACKVSKDLVRGEIVARRLRELDTENPGIYVLISNFYSDVGKWDDAEELREEMRARGIKKVVGGSQVPTCSLG